MAIFGEGDWVWLLEIVGYVMHFIRTANRIVDLQVL